MSNEKIPYGKVTFECPHCGHDNTIMSEDIDNYGPEGSGKLIIVTNYREGSNYLNGNWASWTETITCEKCSKKFKLKDGW
jgi:transcription elongation factor Elf1